MRCCWLAWSASLVVHEAGGVELFSLNNSVYATQATAELDGTIDWGGAHQFVTHRVAVSVGEAVNLVVNSREDVIGVASAWCSTDRDARCAPAVGSRRFLAGNGHPPREVSCKTSLLGLTISPFVVTGSGTTRSRMLPTVVAEVETPARGEMSDCVGGIVSAVRAEHGLAIRMLRAQMRDVSHMRSLESKLSLLSSIMESTGDNKEGHVGLGPRLKRENLLQLVENVDPASYTYMITFCLPCPFFFLETILFAPR